MSSEYESFGLFSRRPPDDPEELERVRERFRAAGRPYLSSPVPWIVWALALPAAALATPRVAGLWGTPGVLLLWSTAILVAGGVEATHLRRAGAGGSPIASWALRVQGNLSLIAVALSVPLVLRGLLAALPGLWLLVLGHSFYALGGLSYRALARFGLTYQLGGVAALLALDASLPIFAATTFVANLGLALAVRRMRRQ